MQETLPNLGRSTCRGATKPVCCNYWSCAHNHWSPHTAETMLGNKEAIVMRSPHTATGEEPPLASTREQPMHNNEDPARPKINETNRSVQFSHSVVSGSMGPHGLQHIRLLCPSPTPRAYSNSCPSSWWCHPTISSSVVPSSSRLQSFLASGSFPMNGFFAYIITIQKWWRHTGYSQQDPAFWFCLLAGGVASLSPLGSLWVWGTCVLCMTLWCHVPFPW